MRRRRRGTPAPPKWGPRRAHPKPSLLPAASTHSRFSSSLPMAMDCYIRPWGQLTTGKGAWVHRQVVERFTRFTATAKNWAGQDVQLAR